MATLRHMPADFVVRNALIADGTGAALTAGDVAISGGRITEAAPGRHTVNLDANGELVCAPGFIDVHTHDDAALIRYPGMEFKVAQGCTSVVIGNCGFSGFPALGLPGRGFPGRGVQDAESIAGATWPDLDGYRTAVEEGGFACNAMPLIGHNTVRRVTLGIEDRREPSPAELAAMRDHVHRAMDQGAAGLSTGLIYRPGKWAALGELIAIAQAAAEHGGVYATHMRDEAAGLLDAVAEALTIGREAGCPVHISHHKASGTPNWGKTAASLALIDAADQDVTLDFYPYIASSGPMAEYVTPDTVTQDWADRNQFASCPPFPRYQGRNVAEVAAAERITVSDLVRRVLGAPGGQATISIGFSMSEADLITNVRHPRMMVGSDGIPELDGLPHPRLFGTFPRIFAEYVRAEQVIALEEAVRRMTSLAADRFGLAGRGRIEDGAHADLVVFDPAAIRDTATFHDPKREPEGIHWVLVNGRLVYDRGRHTGDRPGALLRYRPR